MSHGHFPDNPLSAREEEVMFWLSEGKITKQIADLLDVAITTVLEFIRRALAKLGARNREQGVKLWIRSRISRGLPWEQLQ